MTWIETERLILRDLDENDFEAFARMAADPKIMEFLGRDGKPADREEAWRVLSMIVGHRELRGYTFFAVEEKATGELIGRVGPWQPEGWTDLEIGWGIDSSRWGRGYAIEAARASCDWVHRELGADHVIHYIVDHNVRSIRVAEKLGARAVGRHTLFGTVDCTVWRTELPLKPW